jgi:holin-like protein
MLESLTVFVLFEVAGDLFQTLLQLPIPGPVIGMALLLVALIAKGRLPDELDRTASGILSYLPMMFVPAGVGIMARFDLIRAEWLAICAALVVSFVLAIVITAAMMSAIERGQRAIREAAGNQATKSTVEGAL